MISSFEQGSLVFTRTTCLGNRAGDALFRISRQDNDIKDESVMDGASVSPSGSRREDDSRSA